MKLDIKANEEKFQVNSFKEYRSEMRSIFDFEKISIPNLDIFHRYIGEKVDRAWWDFKEKNEKSAQRFYDQMKYFYGIVNDVYVKCLQNY